MKAPTEFIFATGNAHKVAEMVEIAKATARLAGGPRVNVVKAPRMPPVIENARTFAGNAAKKARALHKLHPDEWVLADDSGLCVDALGGDPGVESANYAGHAAPGAANIGKLLRALEGVPRGRRTAHFVCVLYVVAPDGREFGFEGRVEGMILEAPSGSGGFGYDPVFRPNGLKRSFAELGAAVKNPMSHRGRAWAELAKWLREGGG